MTSPRHAIPSEAASALEKGDMIEAVKLTRGHNGIGLKESKSAVDAYIRANPRFKRRLIAEAPSGGAAKAFGFIALILIAGILYLVSRTSEHI